MEKEAHGVGVVDPLSNYWGLSLFGVSVPPEPSNKPYDPDHDLLAIHNHLRSMALQSPKKLLEQTKSILDSNPGLFNSEIASDPTNDEMGDGFDEEAEKFPRKRRPALGLKRGHFSIKSPKKPSVEDLLPPLDLDKLKDPVEFFLAHDRYKNAKREIEKQLGIVSVEQNRDDTSPKPRQRRPGLPGYNQRSVRYRHRYPKETFDNKDVPSSQEAVGSDNLDPVGENKDKGEACPTSLENEVTDSSAIEDNNLNDILDELLGRNPEDLEGDGAITLLQEKLQIKPIVLEKFSVPDFPDNRVIDHKSLRGNLSKPRKPLHNIDNFLKVMNNGTPIKQGVQRPAEQLRSPTPPRSPFAPLLSLQKRISQSKPSVDPFSAHELDDLSTRNYTPAHTINQEQNLVVSGKPSNKLNAGINNDVIAIRETSSVVDATPIRKDVQCPVEQLGSPTPPRSPFAPLLSPQKHISQSKPSVDPFSVHEVDNLSTRNYSPTHTINREHNLGGSGKPSNKADADINDDVSAISEISSVADAVKSCAGSSGKSKEDNAGKSSNKPNTSLVEDMNAVGEASSVEDTVRNFASTSQKSNEDISGNLDLDANIDSNEAHVDMDVDIDNSGIGEMVVDDTVGGPTFEANGSCEFEDNAGNMQAIASLVPTNESDFNLVDALVADQSIPATVLEDAMDESTQRSDNGPEQCLQNLVSICQQVQEKTDSFMPVNGQNKRKPRSRKRYMDKSLPRRKSLAAAGSSWDIGKRRSTRIRTRPLEYWKGERMVYGRVHESLATVIGLKCLSPGSDGKPTMKVKSYVSDEYKDLLELASLH